MKKDVILFVNAIRPAMFGAFQDYKKKTGRTFTPIVLVDSKIKESITTRNGQHTNPEKTIVLTADFDSAASVRAALRPYMDRLFAVTAQYENSILELKKLVPYIPYLPMPTESSLDWGTEKKLMRQMLESYDTSLVPQYMQVKDASDASINKIEATLEYPVVIKPSGLEGSLLVSLANNRQELKQLLQNTFTMVQDAYNTWIKRQKPMILVEEFMTGQMYSVDVYVAADGVCTFTPIVKVITGRQIGFDDFFGYELGPQTDLDDKETALCYEAVEKAAHAIGLRSVTGHVELMRTPTSWKIIELGPRIGGYRHDLYNYTYGINHMMNDILNRAGEPVDVPTNRVAYAATLAIYAKDEGVIEAINGFDEVKKLQSFVKVYQEVFVGDKAYHAKNNGDPIFEIYFRNKDYEKFRNDIAQMERLLDIQVRPFAKKRHVANSKN